MLIKKLETRFYRNLSGSLPELSCGINILCGENAAGKTNTLEAMFAFASGKSFRTSREKELISRGKDFAEASLVFEKNGFDRSLSLSVTADGQGVKKRMSVDGQPVNKASEFLGQFRAVLFTPDHMSLIKGGPEERRRLVDLALCQIKPRYVKSLNEYEKILAQRNAYLKKVKFGELKFDADYLDVLSGQLSRAGAIIARQRSMFCGHLSQSACEMYSKLTDEREELCVKYIGFSKHADFCDEKQTANELYRIYSKNVDSDLSLGRTFCGPHRDELMIFISSNPENFTSEALKNTQDGELSQADIQDKAALRLSDFAARSFGSQGQQRSAVLSLKLAEGEIIRSLTGEYPVFLLDDLFSELDMGRRSRLSRLLYNRQTVITCCEASGICADSEVNLIHVKDGKYVV